ncbi:aromatic amino acid transaminase [Sphingopyxis panaciterrae]
MTEAALDTRSAPAFGRLQPQTPDALLALIGLHRADPRPSKIDLGVGVYRDETGATPVMQAIGEAEIILRRRQTTKAYLGAEGNQGFIAALAPVALGPALAASPLVRGVQTPGGTGALRLGAELLARAAPAARVWIGTPTWPNHAPIFREAGLDVREHPYFDRVSGEVEFESMLAALEEAAPGDILLVHGCCHNPTGADLSPAQWEALAEFIAARGIIPFADLAYQGLGDGLEADAAGTRLLFEKCPEALLAYSCDKNFALYRERVGALWVQAENDAAAALAFDNMLVLARSLWSMPPDHGAETVRLVLDEAHLRTAWLDELDAMRDRINGLRIALADAEPRLAAIGLQRGLFAMLPIDQTIVERLRADHGIYLAGSGRINVAGLTRRNIGSFVAALGHYLGQPQT